MFRLHMIIQPRLLRVGGLTNVALKQFDAQMTANVAQNVGRLVRRIVAREAHVLVRPRGSQTVASVNVYRLDVDE